MKCPKCGKELDIQDRKVGVDDRGNPIYNKYAICHDCKKMWNLDKQKEKKSKNPASVEHKGSQKTPDTKKDADKIRTAKTPPEKRRNVDPVKSTKPSGSHQAPPRPRQRYGNIPPEGIRLNREKAVKDNYTSMLAADPKSVAVKDRRNQPEKERPVYRAFRIILGIIAVIAAGLFAYMAYSLGIDTLSLNNLQAPIMVYTVLTFCLLLTGIILLSAQKSNSIFAFLIPMLTSLSGTLFALMFRDDTPIVLFCAIGCAVFTAVLLIITITSRFACDDYEDDDDTDDDSFFSDDD